MIFVYLGIFPCLRNAQGFFFFFDDTTLSFLNSMHGAPAAIYRALDFFKLLFSSSFKLKYKSDQHNSATTEIRREECLKQVKSPGISGKSDKIIPLEAGPGMRIATNTPGRIACHL